MFGIARWLWPVVSEHVVRQDGLAWFKQRRDRPADDALWTTAMGRRRSDPRSRVYIEHPTNEGMPNDEIHGRLKRYIVRELYPLIPTDLADWTLAT
jgi:hypothetical protein